MPAIRIMNWNIEKCSGRKLNIAGMAQVIGRIIVNADPDIIVIQEVSRGTVTETMALISGAATAASATLHNYKAWFYSFPTGNECYGFLIKDINRVRPLRITAGADGSPGNYLTNLDENVFATWPNTFANLPNANPPSAFRPQIPLTDLYSGMAPKGRHLEIFGGQVLAAGGGAQGLGFRMPALAMFRVLGDPPAAGGPTPLHLLPIVVNHLGAIRGGAANALALEQTKLFKCLHVAQKYAQLQDLPNLEYIALDGAAVPVRDLIITGDFNIDFLTNSTVGAAPAPRNRRALDEITPTQAGQGSAAPAAVPGALNAAPNPAPFAAPHGGWPVPILSSDIPSLTLRTAVTTTGTILAHYDATAAAAANTLALRRSCFDNFFYGGASLSPAAQLSAAPDAAATIDIPAAIVDGSVAAPAAHQYNLASIWLHNNNDGKRNSEDALSLGYIAAAINALAAIPGSGYAPVVLTNEDRLIGARFISDHLPIVLQFNLA